MSDVVVVGNGVSGYACAARLADRGLHVTLIGPGLPHDRPPLSKRALVTGRVPFLADEAQLAERGIGHVDGVVTACDLDRRRVRVRVAGEASETEVACPILVWATGLEYRKAPIPGLAQAEENTTGLGLASLVRRLAGAPRRIVVVGAGLIGTETAATLAAVHDVTLLDMLDRPLARFLPRVSDAARAALDGVGVRFLGSCLIDSATTDVGGTVIQTSTHGDISCDVVVSAAGFSSSLPSELAGGHPRALTIETDDRLRVLGREDLWACGDCASFPHPRWGRISVPHWDNALWSGRHAAESILGSTDPYVREPYFFSDVGPLRIQQVGIADRAIEWGEDDKGLALGRDADGTPACVLLLNAPTRLREARELLASATPGLG